MPRGFLQRPPKELFEDKFIPEPNSGCWLWIAAYNTNGYGYFRTGSMVNRTRRNEQAHRVSYKLYKGDIPQGLHVCHKCDNKSCVNPEHLFLGTVKDNMQDCVRKNRQKKPNTNALYCKNGHEFTKVNTSTRTDSKSKRCKICTNNTRKKRLLSRTR